MDAHDYLDAYVNLPGKSQKALADKAGLDPRYLSDVRHGRQRVSSDAAEAIGRELVAEGVLPGDKFHEFLWAIRKKRLHAVRLKPGKKPASTAA